LIGALIALERGGGGSIAKPLTTKGTKVHEETPESKGLVILRDQIA
jgi:hypothetical protein